MQNIITLGQINDALKFTTVTAAQLAEMGFAALANKPICEALPQEEARRLRTAKLYPAESIGQIRVALAKRLAAPASCLLQIQEPAPATTEIITALWEAIGHHSAQVAETGEMSPGQKLLDAARAVEMAIPPAAIATLPKSDYLEGVNIPNLREALIFLGRENGVGEGEVGDKLAQYVNSVVSGVLSKKATLHEAPQAAPAAVAVPDETQIKALMRKHRIWIEHSTLLEGDEPQRELRAVQAEQHQFEAFVQDLIELAATPATDVKPFLSEEDLDDLRRFEGMASDGESYDIAKKRMKRLAELGVVRWMGGSRYSMTAFAQYVLKCWDHLPLETHEEANARVGAEFRARIERLNAEAIAAKA